MRKTVSIGEIDGIRVILVDNQAFDWSVEDEHFKSAQIISRSDPAMRLKYLADIQQYLVTCMSEFLGKPVTLSDINRALANGYIDL